MTTLFECDWCGEVFDSRELVASIDLTIGAQNEKLHACVQCVPDYARQYFPDKSRMGDESDELRTDGGEDDASADGRVAFGYGDGENGYTLFADGIDVDPLDWEVWLQAWAWCQNTRQSYEPIWTVRTRDEDGDLRTDGGGVAHLHCRKCGYHPTVAKIDGSIHLVCHCTHIDGEIPPVVLHGFDSLPERWGWSGGTGDTEVKRALCHIFVRPCECGSRSFALDDDRIARCAACGKTPSTVPAVPYPEDLDVRFEVMDDD